jgi:hypothetical protein
MTAAVLERPSLFAERRAKDGGGTLEGLLGSALDEVRANGSTECPVCHARMSSTRVGAREAECGGCGSRLS